MTITVLIISQLMSGNEVLQLMIRNKALENVCSRFRIPLQKADVNCFLVTEEWDDMVDYVNT